MTQPTIDNVRKATAKAATQVGKLADAAASAADAATAKRDETKAAS